MYEEKNDDDDDDCLSFSMRKRRIGVLFVPNRRTADNIAIMKIVAVVATRILKCKHFVIVVLVRLLLQDDVCGNDDVM